MIDVDKWVYDYDVILHEDCVFINFGIGHPHRGVRCSSPEIAEKVYNKMKIVVNERKVTLGTSIDTLLECFSD